MTTQSPQVPKLVVDLPCETGEGPLWHPHQHVLYWVDIPAGRLYRYDPATETNELVYQHSAEIGGFTFQVDGSILLFCSRGEILRWQNGDLATIIADIPAELESRFNDVVAAPGGQVLCGTMPTGDQPGNLYRLNLDGSLTLIFDDIECSNGFGFTEDEQSLYYTDSNQRVIWQIPLDPLSGELGERTVLVSTAGEDGVPDGMCVDSLGTIWSARWDGHGLFHYAADGSPLGKVEFPVRKVSSVAFGGPDLRTAYVTTAGGNQRGPVEGDLAGSLFQVDLGVAGKPIYYSQIGLKS